MRIINVDVDAEGKYLSRFPYHPATLELIKSVPSRVWDGERKAHVICEDDIELTINTLNDNACMVATTPQTNLAIVSYVNRKRSLIALKNRIITGPVDCPELKLAPKHFQIVGSDYMVYAQQALLGDDTGIGKAQPLTSFVLTPLGFKKMGDLKIGDYISHPNKKNNRIIGIYPQGKVPVYRITFTDETVTECTAQHLWAIQTKVHKQRKVGYKILPLSEIKKNTFKSSNFRWYIPLVKPIRFKSRKLEIYPYLLGVLLGDGSIVRPSKLLLSTIDKDILEKVNKLLPKDMTLRHAGRCNYRIIKKNFGCMREQIKKNTLAKHLKRLKLIGCNSYTKFIPKIYKMGSVKCRINILQGLMDTDGYINPYGHTEYSTVSKKLANDVTFIVQSLGGIARIKNKLTYCNQKPCFSYLISITMPKNIIPFQLQRKINRISKNRKYFPVRGIKRIKYIGKKECQCIKVSAQDGLYITDNFLVTHNTMQLVFTFLKAKTAGMVKKMIVLCPSTIKDNWSKDIVKFTDLRPLIIEGTPDERKELYQKYFDIIIISYETFLIDFCKNKNIMNNSIFDNIGMMVLDEAQRLVRAKNKTSQAIDAFINKRYIPFFFPATATPLVNKIEDLWFLFHLIKPTLFGEFWQFRNRYCVVQWDEIKMLDPKLRKKGIFKKIKKKVPKVIGYQNLEELKLKIEPYYIRREKREVLPELPPKTFKTYEIELKPKQRALYSKLQIAFRSEFKDKDINAANALVWFIRAQQICDMSELVDPEITDSAKLDEFKEIIIDMIDAGHKILVFSRFKEATDILVRELTDTYKLVYLNGEVRPIDKPILIDEFKSNLDCRLFISTIRCGGVGLNLPEASIAILYDKWLSPTGNSQAGDRMERLDQDKAMTVIDFRCKNTIEERIEVILARKNLMHDGIFGDDNSILAKLSPEELLELI